MATLTAQPARLVHPSSLTPHPHRNLVPDMRAEEWQDFYSDIAFRGIKTAIEVDANGVILDGHHRHRAATQLGVTHVPVVDATLAAGEDGTTYMLKAAVLRRHLTDDQRAMIAARWIQEHKQPPHPGPGRGNKTEVPRGTSVSTREQAASDFQIPVKKVIRTTFVQNHAPELAERVFAGEIPLNEAYREAKKQERTREIEAKPTPNVNTVGSFSVLYVDPPWRYDFEESGNREIENQYPTMTLDEMKTMRLPAEADSVLFMWATSPKLTEALALMIAWGFEYRTSLVWIKDKIGMGYYARQQHELLLVGKRGSFPVPDPENRPSSVIQAPRGVHSAKPSEVYELLDRMYPKVAKVELFARNAHERPLWKAWGNQS